MKYFIANWKANKNYDESSAWLNNFITALQDDLELKKKLDSDQICIIICPPFPFLLPLKTLEVTSKNVFVGAQSVSDKESGAFTGEVTAKSLEGLASYSIIGHSERRSHYGETNEILKLKTEQALAHTIKPILCISGNEDTIFDGVTVIAYEPVSAIGTGNNMPLAEVLQNKTKLNIDENKVFIYGGSVNPQTASEYIHSDEIDGFLIGGASLEPATFLQIVKSY